MADAAQDAQPGPEPEPPYSASVPLPRRAPRPSAPGRDEDQPDIRLLERILGALTERR
ncbi:hypothetical protein [Pseudonocardia ailaonensis]